MRQLCLLTFSLLFCAGCPAGNTTTRRPTAPLRTLVLRRPWSSTRIRPPPPATPSPSTCVATTRRRCSAGPPAAPSATRRAPPATPSGDARCDDAACRVDQIELTSDGLRLHLVGTRPMATALHLTVTTSDGRTLTDSTRLSFADPTRLAIERNPAWTPGAETGVLVGTRLLWCARLVTDEGAPLALSPEPSHRRLRRAARRRRALRSALLSCARCRPAKAPSSSAWAA